MPYIAWILDVFDLDTGDFICGLELAGMTDGQVQELLHLEDVGPGLYDVPSSALIAISQMFNIDVDEGRYDYVLGQGMCP